MEGVYDFKVLRALRQQQKLTLDNLSKISGLSYPTIALIETNKTSPSLKTLDALATALKTPVSKLISLAECNLVKTDSAKLVHTQILKSSNINLDTLHLVDFQGLRIFRGTVKNGKTIKSRNLHNGCDCNEICFCLGGSIEIRIKDDIYRLKANDVIIFDGCLDHEYTTTDKTDYLVIHLPKDCTFMDKLIKNKNFHRPPNTSFS
jgi:transcriptional regulator with XRE-family HTH domain